MERLQGYPHFVGVRYSAQGPTSQAAFLSEKRAHYPLPQPYPLEPSPCHFYALQPLLQAFAWGGGGVQGGLLVKNVVDGAGSYSVAHRAGLLPTELTAMWGWILLRSPHQGRGSPPAPAPTKQRPALLNTQRCAMTLKLEPMPARNPILSVQALGLLSALLHHLHPNGAVAQYLQSLHNEAPASAVPWAEALVRRVAEQPPPSARAGSARAAGTNASSAPVASATLTPSAQRTPTERRTVGSPGFTRALNVTPNTPRGPRASGVGAMPASQKVASAVVHRALKRSKGRASGAPQAGRCGMGVEAATVDSTLLTTGAVWVWVCVGGMLVAGGAHGGWASDGGQSPGARRLRGRQCWLQDP